MENNFDYSEESKQPRKRKKLKSQKKPKYNLSKIQEYQNYLDDLRLMSRGDVA